jgi:hypothetical protein
MPTEFFIDTHQKLVISRGTGTYRHADHIAHMEAVGKDPRFQPEFNHLVDCRGFGTMDLTPAQVHDISSRSNFGSTSKRVMIVSSALQFGLGRMFAAYREIRSGQITMVFRELEGGFASLGLPKDYNPDSLGESTHIPEQ